MLDDGHPTCWACKWWVPADQGATYLDGYGRCHFDPVQSGGWPGVHGKSPGCSKHQWWCKEQGDGTPTAE